MLKVKDFLRDQEIFQSPHRPTNPAVSVIMPIYCHNGQLLDRAIDSVLAQTFEDFEFIIVDDGSRDGSFETAMRYAEKDSRIVVIRHRLNSGLPAIRVNEGVLESLGIYVAYQFDDDEWLPNCLEDLHAAIVKHEEPCVVFGEAMLQNVMDTSDKRRLGFPFNHALLMDGNRIVNNSVLHHKNIFELSGMYDPHIMLRRLCDWDLWLRMGTEVNFYLVEKKVSLVNFNNHNSLGQTVNINCLSRIRRFMELSRKTDLLPGNIAEYDVCSLPADFFSQEEQDFLYRVEILPFLNKSSYILYEQQKKTYSLSRRSKKNIVLLKNDYSTSVDVTFRNFLQRLNGLPYTFSFFPSRNGSVLETSNADIIVFYRDVTTSSVDLNRYYHQRGTATAYWIDDNMFRFHEDGPQFAYLSPNSERHTNLCTLISETDLTVSYSSVISEDCREHTSSIFELSTNIPSRYFPQESLPAADRIHFAVFSGNVRKEIFERLWGALEQIADEYAEKIDITFWGIDPMDYPPLKCPVRHQPFTHSYEFYLKKLQSNAFHFQICPLDDEKKTNRSKSPVKFLEGLVAGAVSLFSDVPPYDRLPDDVCLKAGNTTTQWHSLLKQVVRMPEDERQKLFQNARAFALERYTTESQVVDFVTALDLTLLRRHLDGRAIVYVAHESPLGGATLHILRHLLLMRGLGIEVLLCLPDDQKGRSGLPEYVRRFGIDEILYLPCRHSAMFFSKTDRDLNDGKNIANLFKGRNVGLICSATYMPALGVAAREMLVPNMVTLHQYYPNPDFTNYGECNIQAIHSSSNRYAMEYRRLLGVPANRIVCPVDEVFWESYGGNFKRNPGLLSSGGAIHILVSGTLQPRKNQLEAIQAIQLLRETGHNVKLTFIGYDNLVPDYADKCREAAEALGDAVEIVGFTDAPECYYQQCCPILLCTSTDESMPQTILQAMAAGVFVVSSNCGGVSEIIKDNYNGILLNNTGAKEFAEGIARLLGKVEAELGFILENAHDTISAIATPKFVRSELINLYNTAFEEFPNSLLKKPDMQKLYPEEMVLHDLEGAEEVFAADLTGQSILYMLPVRKRKLFGLQFVIASSFDCKCQGILTAELILDGLVVRKQEFDVSPYALNDSLRWNFVELDIPEKSTLTLSLTYAPRSEDEHLYVQEKRARSWLDGHISSTRLRVWLGRLFPKLSGVSVLSGKGYWLD